MPRHTLSTLLTLGASGALLSCATPTPTPSPPTDVPKEPVAHQQSSGEPTETPDEPAAAEVPTLGPFTDYPGLKVGPLPPPEVHVETSGLLWPTRAKLPGGLAPPEGTRVLMSAPVKRGGEVVAHAVVLVNADKKDKRPLGRAFVKGGFGDAPSLGLVKVDGTHIDIQTIGEISIEEDEPPSGELLEALSQIRVQAGSLVEACLPITMWRDLDDLVIDTTCVTARLDENLEATPLGQHDTTFKADQPPGNVPATLPTWGYIDVDKDGAPDLVELKHWFAMSRPPRRVVVPLVTDSSGEPLPLLEQPFLAVLSRFEDGTGPTDERIDRAWTAVGWVSLAYRLADAETARALAPLLEAVLKGLAAAIAERDPSSAARDVAVLQGALAPSGPTTFEDVAPPSDVVFIAPVSGYDDPGEGTSCAWDGEALVCRTDAGAVRCERGSACKPATSVAPSWDVSPDGGARFVAMGRVNGELHVIVEATGQPCKGHEGYCGALGQCRAIPWGKLRKATSDDVVALVKIPVESMPTDGYEPQTFRDPCYTDQHVAPSTGFVGWLDDDRVLVAAGVHFYDVDLTRGEVTQIEASRIPQRLHPPAGIDAGGKSRTWVSYTVFGFILWRAQLDGQGLTRMRLVKGSDKRDDAFLFDDRFPIWGNGRAVSGPDGKLAVTVEGKLLGVFEGAPAPE